MNRKVSILVFSILFLLIGVYLIGNGIQVFSNPPSIKNNANSSIDTKSYPKLSGEGWYRKGYCRKNNITINEMDTYNKTGAVYLIGYNESKDTSDIFLVKYNAIGQQVWNKSINGGSGWWNYGTDLVVNQSSGEVYIVGTIFNNTNIFDVFIAKYDSYGDQAWNITWGYEGRSESGEGIALDNNGNLYIVGCNYTSVGLDPHADIFIAKFNLLTLSQEWNVTWKQPLDSILEDGRDIACGHYGNIYIAGYTDEDDDGEEDMVLICYNENGVQQWNKTYNVNNYKTYGNNVAVDSNDDVYIVGSTSDPTYNGYMVLRKYSNQSDLKWEKTWWGLFGYANGEDIYIDADDNAIVAVRCAEFVSESKLRVIGYNPSGTQILNLEWRSVNLNVNEEIFSYCVSGFGTDNFYIGGFTEEDDGNDNYILVCNPSYSMVSGGGTGVYPSVDDDDDDDNDDGGNGSLLEIPSYNLYIILGIICIGSVILVKKNYKRL